VHLYNLHSKTWNTLRQPDESFTGRCQITFRGHIVQVDSHRHSGQRPASGQLDSIDFLSTQERYHNVPRVDGTCENCEGGSNEVMLSPYWMSRR